MKYWLFKSEPDCYSIDDLKKEKVGHWDGVRNYQARNFIRDEIKKGDTVLFYHSSCAEPAIVGTAKVVTDGYPDHTAWDSNSEHPDAKSTPEKPLWYMVDITFESKWEQPVTLKEMRTMRALEDMRLLSKGNRLSVFPVLKKHFDTVLQLSTALRSLS